MRSPILLIVAWLACLLVSAGALAREAPPLAEDAALEARVMDLAQELRCLVCQNETLAASHADLAIDLRQQIRNRLKAGASAQQVRDFMVERYGEFVLYRPLLNAKTLLLWLGPFALLAVAIGALVLTIRRRNAATADPDPAPQDSARARHLLGLPEETRP